jgi:tetratricopeptide (TPR) repeat protein
MKFFLLILNIFFVSPMCFSMETDVLRPLTSTHTIKQGDAEFEMSHEKAKELGMNLFYENKLSEALPFLLLSKDLGGAPHKEAIGYCYLERNDFKQAANWFIEAALHEASLQIAGDSTNLIKVYSEEAFYFLKDGKKDKALKSLEDVLREEK